MTKENIHNSKAHYNKNVPVSQDHNKENVPVSQDHHTKNIPVSEDHHITTKMDLFHKTIAMNSTCFTKPSAKYISVSQDHGYKTYLFYKTNSKDMNQIQKTIIKKIYLI